MDGQLDSSADAGNASVVLIEGDLKLATAFLFLGPDVGLADETPPAFGQATPRRHIEERKYAMTLAEGRVFVREYSRTRYGRLETVTSHTRRWPCK